VIAANTGEWSSNALRKHPRNAGAFPTAQDCEGVELSAPPKKNHESPYFVIGADPLKIGCYREGFQEIPDSADGDMHSVQSVAASDTFTPLGARRLRYACPHGCKGKRRLLHGYPGGRNGIAPAQKRFYNARAGVLTADESP